MKLFTLLVSIIFFTKGFSQQINDSSLTNLIVLCKTDTSAYIKNVNKIGYSSVPSECVFKLAEMEFNRKHLEEAKTALEYLYRNRNNLTYVRYTIKDSHLLKAHELEVDIIRSLREVYILLSQFDKAIPLIDEEEVTYLDVHADGDWANGWIESRKQIDYSRCNLGRGDTLKALNSLFWDKCFFTEGFDVESHFKTLSQIIGNEDAAILLKNAFKSPICVSRKVGNGNESITYIDYVLIIYDNTIFTPHTLIHYEDCETIPKNIVDSVRLETLDNYYYKYICKKTVKLL
ncbi:MAG: hypothetical protein JKY53_06850 [Flavobacteriales bacterium]|nr:hypothetical protein [Flavobacteriales bacterium]